MVRSTYLKFFSFYLEFNQGVKERVLYVRGGSPDQNLMLLDGVPLYSVNHLFGFFSVFNADAVRSMSITKGGYPARYGGRLSSILEIHMKDGHMKEYHADATVSVIASKLTVEGPLVKDKASFMISGTDAPT